jgi:hypothetical protein
MTAKAPMPVRDLNLVVPLAHEATAMRTTETTAAGGFGPGAVSELIGIRLRLVHLTVAASPVVRFTRPCTSWNGIGVPQESAAQGRTARRAAFLIPCPISMVARQGGRKACRLPLRGFPGTPTLSGCRPDWRRGGSRSTTGTSEANHGYYFIHAQHGIHHSQHCIAGVLCDARHVEQRPTLRRLVQHVGATCAVGSVSPRDVFCVGCADRCVDCRHHSEWASRADGASSRTNDTPVQGSGRARLRARALAHAANGTTCGLRTISTADLPGWRPRACLPRPRPTAAP